MSEYLNEKVVLGLVGILCLGTMGTLVLAALDQPIPAVLGYGMTGILAALLALLSPGSPGSFGPGSPGTAEDWEWVYEDPEDDPDPGEEAPLEQEAPETSALGRVIPFSRAA